MPSRNPLRGVPFYGTGHGDSLIAPSNFPGAVSRYLDAELFLLETIAPRYSMLVEVGCMQGRWLEWAEERLLSYIGLDVVPSFIAALHSRIQERLNNRHSVNAHVCDATAKDGIRNVIGPHMHAHRILLFFPFNSIGNMHQLKLLVANLAPLIRDGVDTYISTYRTTVEANYARELYYCNCKYRSLRRRKLVSGVAFTSREGLRTIAYHPPYVRKLFRSFRVDIETRPLSAIGIAYVSCAHFLGREQYAERSLLPQEAQCLTAIKSRGT